MIALIKSSEVLEALLQTARITSTRSSSDGVYYGTLSLSVLADTLFGIGSPESVLIESYCSSSPLSSFVGPVLPSGGAL